MEHDVTEALEIEKYLIPYERWHEAPEEAYKIAEEEKNSGPVGLAKHPTKGWFVLMTGQGPFIAWREHENG